MFNKVVVVISVVVIAVSGWFIAKLSSDVVVVPTKEEEVVLHPSTKKLIDEYIKNSMQDEEVFGAIVQLVGGFTYNLAGAGISSSDTSITLRSLTLPQTDQLLLDGDFSETFYITLEPGSRDRQEIASCTTVVQNSSGSATLSGCTRGLSPIPDYTASTTLQFTHGGGSQVIFSDPPQVFEQFAALDNDESITHTWTFDADNLPQADVGVTATSGVQFITLDQLNNVTNQGAATSTETNGGIVELATQLEIASTTLDVTSKPRVIRSLFSTTTPSHSATRANNFLVVTQSNGFIKQLFIDLTESFFFTASTTIDAVLNVGNTIIHGTIELANIIYNWPSSQTADTFLKTDGSGNLSWAGVPQRIFIPCLENNAANATSTANLFGAIFNDGAIDSCFSNFTIPVGQSITRFHVWGTGSGNANNVVFRIEFYPMTDATAYGVADDTSGDVTFTDFTSNTNMQLLVFASTSYDGITAARPYQIRILRNGNAAADNNTGDIRIGGIQIQTE